MFLTSFKWNTSIIYLSKEMFQILVIFFVVYVIFTLLTACPIFTAYAITRRNN